MTDAPTNKPKNCKVTIGPAGHAACTRLVIVRPWSICDTKHLPTDQGDLGAIDEQYDVAISTACGALDHIVVDSMDTAIRCVEFLKRGNVGMATFIALDKVMQIPVLPVCPCVCLSISRLSRPSVGEVRIIVCFSTQVEHWRKKATSKIQT